MCHCATSQKRDKFLKKPTRRGSNLLIHFSQNTFLFFLYLPINQSNIKDSKIAAMSAKLEEVLDNWEEIDEVGVSIYKKKN